MSVGLEEAKILFGTCRPTTGRGRRRRPAAVRRPHAPDPHETLGREPLSADGLVSWMDEQGIDRAVVQALDSPRATPVQAPSWWVLEQVESSSDRLIPFCSVDPGRWPTGAEAVENLLEGTSTAALAGSANSNPPADRQPTARDDLRTLRRVRAPDSVPSGRRRPAGSRGPCCGPILRSISSPTRTSGGPTFRRT